MESRDQARGSFANRIGGRRAALLLTLPLWIWLLYLVLLPVFPSQDGPTHLMSGGILYDCIADREPASSYYFWRSGKLTNQLCTLGLGLFGELGLGPRVAEGLWHLLLLGLLVWVWSRMLGRIEATTGSVLLVLLPFMGQVLHMGFYNFLAGVHLGMLAWTFRRPGWRNPACDLLFLLAVYAHPLGAATFLGLCGWDALIQRRWKDLPTLAPHAALFLWVSMGNTGGKMIPTPIDVPDLFGATWVPFKIDILLFVRLPLLLLLLLVLKQGWASLSTAARSRRLQLLVAGMVPLLATGFVPEIFGTATHLRIRAAYLGWILVLMTLAPMALPGGRWLLGAVQALVLGLLATTFVADRQLADELETWMTDVAVPTRGATVLAGYDQYQSDFWPRVQGLLPVGDVPLPRNRILDIQSRLHFDPWLHIPDRWAHEHGALGLNDHQALYAHSPLGHRNPPSMSWREGIEYKCSQVSLEDLAGAARQILLSHLDPDWLKHAEARIPKSLRIVGQGRDWVLFESLGPRDPESRLARPFFTDELKNWPVPWPILAHPTDGRIQCEPPFDKLNALRPFEAYVLDPDAGQFRLAGPGDIAPQVGIYDAQGGFLFESLSVPTRGQLVLMPR